MSKEPLKKRAKGRTDFSDMEPDILRGARNNDLFEVKAALERDKTDINKQDSVLGLTALHYAASKGNISMVEFLLEQDHIDLSLQDRWGRDAADVAILSGHASTIDAIVRKLDP